MATDDPDDATSARTRVEVPGYIGHNWACTRSALLLPHRAAGTGRQTMLYGCYAMFGPSLVGPLNIIAMIWARLTLYGTSGTARFRRCGSC